MSELFFEMISLPFMQRALLAGLLLGILLASLGVLATLRKMAFFGDGVAHASLAGIAIAMFASFAPLPAAIAWAVIIAILIFWLERSTKLPSDTLIGILFTASMAFGVILMSQTQGYQPELISFLFGSILSIRTLDLIFIAVCTCVVLLWFFPSLRSLVFLSLSEESAHVHGIRTRIQTLLFYIALAIATVLGVKILGIVLVSALLVLPPATARTLSHSFKSYLFSSIIISEVTILFGIVVSYLFDYPTGAVIVLSGTLVFFLTAFFKKIFDR